MSGKQLAPGEAATGDPGEPTSLEAAMAVLAVLVRLKDGKDRDGETLDYRSNKDAAWEAARQLLAKHTATVIERDP